MGVQEAHLASTALSGINRVGDLLEAVALYHVVAHAIQSRPDECGCSACRIATPLVKHHLATPPGVTIAPAAR